MTAENSGTGAMGVLSALRRLREQWVLVVALASALFWARDMAEVYGRLPAEMARHAQAVAGLAERIAGLEARLGPIMAGEIPLAFGPAASPGTAGAVMVLHWQPRGPEDPACAAGPGATIAGPQATARAHGARSDPSAGPAGVPEEAPGVFPRRTRGGLGGAGAGLRASGDCPQEQGARRSPWFPFVPRGD